MANTDMSTTDVLLKTYYYRPLKNKNIKIHCLDKYYIGGTSIHIVQDNYYSVLKATNKLDNCIFIFQFDYNVNVDNKPENRTLSYYFKLVSEKEFKMYQDMDIINKIKEKEPEIKRPKKHKD